MIGSTFIIQYTAPPDAPVSCNVTLWEPNARCQYSLVIPYADPENQAKGLSSNHLLISRPDLGIEVNIMLMPPGREFNADVYIYENFERNPYPSLKSRVNAVMRSINPTEKQRDLASLCQELGMIGVIKAVRSYNRTIIKSFPEISAQLGHKLHEGMDADKYSAIGRCLWNFERALANKCQVDLGSVDIHLSHM